MKHAILIIGHKNFESIIEIVNKFDEQFNFYIHLDKKSKLVYKNTKFKYNNVFIVEKYYINWAGYNTLKASLLLCNLATSNTENQFFHLISGEDYPTKSSQYFLNLDKSKNYLTYFKLPSTIWNGNGGMDRIQYYNLYDIFNAKNRIQNRLILTLISIQKALGLKRCYNIKFPELYGGSAFWSLNRTALMYISNFIEENKFFLKRFKYTYCSDEMFFQTILVNSNLNSTIVNNNLRYIDWDSGRGGYPAYLDETDFDNIVNSSKIFARKLNNTTSVNLKKKISSSILNC